MFLASMILMMIASLALVFLMIIFRADDESKFPLLQGYWQWGRRQVDNWNSEQFITIYDIFSAQNGCLVIGYLSVMGT